MPSTMQIKLEGEEMVEKETEKKENEEVMGGTKMARFTRNQRAEPRRGRYKFHLGQARADPGPGRDMAQQGQSFLKIELQDLVEREMEKKKANERRMQMVKGEFWDGKLMLIFPSACPCLSATFPWPLDEVGECYLESTQRFRNGGSLMRHFEVKKLFHLSC